jgi:hypothetical protein
MKLERLVLVQGMGDTRATLERWNANPWPVLRGWLIWSLLTAIGLLMAVYVVARLSTPDPTRLAFPGVNVAVTLGDFGNTLLRNGLVLALHAMACVAGFIAGSSVPQLAAERTGWSRAVHERAGSFAIGFVVCATAFSLVTQAYALGGAASTLAAQFGISPALLLVGLLPHAIPELTALFLPLAAWVLASRRGQWNELLAATIATVAIAVPVLIASALVELYVSPRLIIALAGG